jgi:hypothetical protein
LAVTKQVVSSGARLAVLVLVAGASMAAGCAAAPPRVEGSAQPGLALTLLDIVILPTLTNPPDGRRESWFGSLSGLAQDPRSGRYVGAIDDREPSRIAWVDIAAKNGHLSVVPGEVLPTHPTNEADARAVISADLEALVALPDGQWVASEEGHVLSSERGYVDAEAWPPVLLLLNDKFEVTEVWPWPERFALGAVHGGVRENQGFEGLTRTPDGRLIAGLEQPLYGDMPVPLRNGRAYGGGRGGPGRLVELTGEPGQWVTRREWVYPLDPTPRRAGEEICDDGENGLTELLALDATRLISLERACLIFPGGVRNTARVYLTDTAGADDVSPQARRPVSSARPVSKRLLIDFEDLIPRWPPELAHLDNFEALAFGPPLPDGRRTLIVASDDNFRASQHTVFVWFAIDEVH